MNTPLTRQEFNDWANKTWSGIMIKQDIIRMALKSGFKEHNGMIYVTTINDDCAKELKALVDLVRADERNSWPAEMEAMERQVNILTDALAEARRNT